LDAPLGEDSDGQIKDILEDESLAAPDEQVELFFNKERARVLLDTLEQRERTIIEMRYGLTDGDCYTLAQIARKLNLSRERVRQIEELTINKLKQTLKEQED
jgi:RNA polymerase primary sigma factor